MATSIPLDVSKLRRNPDRDGPRYLCEHVPTEVRCQWCGATFLHTELRSDRYDDPNLGGEMITVQNICPQCERADCCQVQYEDAQALGEAMRR